MQRNLNISLLCGGPSLERGISLNSARSVMDHLDGGNIEINPIYFDSQKRAYHISKSQLYSNTPSDFDFKLKTTSKALSNTELIDLLRKADLAFVAIHGPFGEDGEIQSFLEKHQIPFVGSGSETCKQIFDKFKANEAVKSLGFYTMPSKVLKIYKNDHKQIIDEFFAKYKIKRAVVKPASGGSSIGVFSVSTPKEALEQAETLFSKRMDTRVVIEPFAEGVEFTVIVLENRFGIPVAIIPTEIETDYTEHQIFDFRKKYLPTRQVTYHCPPRFSNEVIEKIQVMAEQFFAAFGFRDFARFDGWVLPDGNIWFSDFNPVSGMEQNSFLFQQSSRIGLTHKGLLQTVVFNACRRYNIKLPEASNKYVEPKKLIRVLFGGATSERQVSLISGTNVWLKLKKSQKFKPEPYLLDTEGSIWKLPYALTLNHTVEEIVENCKNYHNSHRRLGYLENKVSQRLALNGDFDLEPIFEPKKLSMNEFLDDKIYVFNALHGGAGEDGTLQALFQKAGIKYNGPNSKASALCADKWQTREAIQNIRIKDLTVVNGVIYETRELNKIEDLNIFLRKLKRELKAKSVIVKPPSDGCSSGVVKINSAKDLTIYLKYLFENAPFIPKGSFADQLENIEMPTNIPQKLIFEEYIETDYLRVRRNSLKHKNRGGWLEVTVGVYGQKGRMRSFNPSITIAEGEVLSVEEKFQGGTGVNITPPPLSLVKKEAIKKTRYLIARIANELGLSGYSRIDAFMNIKTGALKVIEINTLPGLTPSTVIFHQALAERPKIYPTEFLEKIIEDS